MPVLWGSFTLTYPHVLVQVAALKSVTVRQSTGNNVVAIISVIIYWGEWSVLHSVEVQAVNE